MSGSWPAAGPPRAADRAPAGGAAPGAETVWRPAFRWMSRRRCARWSAAAATPPHRVGDGAFWRAALTPDGPATLALRVPRPGEVHATAWGPGAEWAVAGVPDLLGARDDPGPFTPRWPLLAETARRHPGLRVPRTGLVLDALLPAILEQKVTGTEARQAWRFLLHRYGTPAPGPAPAGMRVPPARRVLLEHPRPGTGTRPAWTSSGSAPSGPPRRSPGGWRSAATWRRPTRWPGCGWSPASAVWTAAETAQRALGDADALSVGDFHIHDLVGWALLGHPLSDEGMLELLEPPTARTGTGWSG